MFKLLRSKAKMMYWFIALTFLGFGAAGGFGAGMKGCSPGGSGSAESGIVGSVNGQKITAQDYDANVRQQAAFLRQQSPSGDLNANQYATARQRAWDAMVRNALVEQAIADRKIKASDAEVLDAFQNNPPMEILAAYRDETGNVDIERYFADLQNPEADWSRAEAYVRDVYLPQVKLLQEVSADAFVTDEEVREEYTRQTARAVAAWVGMAYTDVTDGYQPTDEEIQAWFDGHQADYQRPARVEVEAVRFAKDAGEGDYEEVRQFLLEIRQQIVSGAKTFAEAAAEYSEDGTAQSGGDLGTFDRNRMVAPFTEAAFSLPVGEVSEPVRTRFGYHLIEVTGQEKNADGTEVERVTARHILLRVTPGPATLDALREAAEAFRDGVAGGGFGSKAEAEAMDLVKPAAFQAGRDIPGMAMTLAGGNWAFAAKTGAVSPVFENDQFLYVVHKLADVPAGPATLDEVKGQVTLALRQDHNRAVIRGKLGPAAGEMQMGADPAVAAANHGLKHAVTDTFTINGNVTDLGYGTAFNAAAINGTVGTVVPEVETVRGLYALVPLWIQPVDEADYAARAEGIRNALLQQKQSELIEAWFAAEIAKADIKDHRAAMGMGV